MFYVNQVFEACIHDTNIIPECQSKQKLTKIILSLIVGVIYEIYLTQPYNYITHIYWLYNIYI